MSDSAEIEVGQDQHDGQEEDEASRRREQQADGLGSHDEALALLRPRVVLLVRGVDQWICPLVLLDVLPKRLNRFREGPPLHLGLVPEIFDLLLQAVLIHSGRCDDLLARILCRPGDRSYLVPTSRSDGAGYEYWIRA